MQATGEEARSGGAALGVVGARRGQVIALAAAIVVFGFGVVAVAHVMDDFGPPPPGDPSEFTGPRVGTQEAIDDLAQLPDANLGAFDGGTTGTEDDAFDNNSLGENDVDSSREFDVPTGGPLSPLFGAGEFEQQMLRFEEFGPEPLADAPALTTPFPSPTTGPAPEQDPNSVAASNPAGAAIEAFLDEPGISPFPTQFANDIDENPWSPGDRGLARPSPGLRAGRRKAAGQGLVPPAVERVLPPGLLQHDRLGSPDQRRLAGRPPAPRLRRR